MAMAFLVNRDTLRHDFDHAGAYSTFRDFGRNPAVEMAVIEVA